MSIALPPTIVAIRNQAASLLSGLNSGIPISSTVRFPVNPQQEATFLRMADSLTSATRRLPGCNVFAFNRAIDTPADAPVFLIYEDWETLPQFMTQWNSDHLQEFQAQVGNTLAGAPELIFYQGWKEYRVTPQTSQPSAQSALPSDYPFKSHFADVLGARMHYIDEGSGDVFLFLHGNPTWSYLWRNIIPLVKPLGRCIAPDLIGYGRSQKIIGLSWEEHYRHVEAFIRKMKLRNVTLVLHDHGSALGFNYFRNHPSNVKAIAFMESLVRPFTWSNFSTPEFRTLFQDFKTGGIGGEGWQMIVDQNVFINQVLPAGAGGALSPQAQGAYAEPFRTQENRRSIWVLSRATPIGGEPANVVAAAEAWSLALQNSPIPKLMLYATPGGLLTAEHVQWCQANFPNLKSVFLGPGVHFVQEQYPTQIGTEIANWYRQTVNPAAGAGAGQVQSPFGPVTLPDISPDDIQRYIDEACSCNIRVQPAECCTISPGAGGSEFSFAAQLRRSISPMSQPRAGQPAQAIDRDGEVIGNIVANWTFISPQQAMRPGEQIAGIPFNPSVSQRFAMNNDELSFGDGRDGFRGFGAGYTIPNGGNASVMAVGTILRGMGRFSGLTEGTYILCGTFDPSHGFTGNISLRVADPARAIHTSSSLPSAKWRARRSNGVTWMTFRGQASPDDAVEPNIGPNGQPIGLVVHQGLRLVDMDCFASRDRRFNSRTTIGRSIGNITARVVFDPSAPGGDAANPIPFANQDELVFTDQSGRNVGSLTARSVEGRVFKVNLAGGVQGIRFGGIGPISGGTGIFQGASGLMTDNSLVTFVPHLSASIYVLRLNDPDGRFAARFTE